MSDFIIRPYSKKELAVLYFPHLLPHSAVNHLMSWIYQADDLLEKLKAAGYQKSSKMLTPRQVQIIVDDFGEP